jgi:hypothetical protein
MPSARMIVNGHDLSTYGMWVETPRGWASGPGRQDRSLDIQGAGEMVLPRSAKMRGRRWQVDFTLVGSSQPDVLQKWDALKLHLHNAWLEVMILPWSDRVCLCRYDETTWGEGRLDDEGFHGSLSFYSPSAYLVSPIVDPYTITPESPAELILGTAPSSFILEVIGSFLNPTFTLYDANGQVRGNLNFQGNVPDREWLSYNSQTGAMVYHTATGTERNGASLFGDSSREFNLDPMDGVPERGPVLALDNGSAVLYLRKAFL